MPLRTRLTGLGGGLGKEFDDILEAVGESNEEEDVEDKEETEMVGVIVELVVEVKIGDDMR